MGGFDARQRRDLLALLCRVAWADGVVVHEERERLLEVLGRLGAGAVDAAELSRWLEHGPPRVTGALPPEARQLFLNEALRVMSADCEAHPDELRTIRETLNYYFTRLDEVMVG